MLWEIDVLKLLKIDEKNQFGAVRFAKCQNYSTLLALKYKGIYF